jgi:hypothetical protein
VAIDVLSLPTDIPWERICVSPDMIDQEVCDRRFPPQWRTSLAVFGYEPPADQQNYEGMIVSYLKVVCTVTGYQVPAEATGLKDRRIHRSFYDSTVIDNYKDVMTKYYGCYGALLHVAISPHAGAEVAVSDYPYFADFEPKKRELYEAVSDTGEVMSRSLENVNVRKGATTSDSHEVLDIFGGFSAQASYAGTGGGVSVNGQWGTKDVSSQEYTNVRTTDQAREMRETYSHTTQLTQMYHQLDSYHLGTNRTIFFMLPRPHIVQSELTFVNGPRLLEGIQEVFLVVLRPEGQEEFCVEAYLETAHVVSEPIFTYQTSTGEVSLHVEKHAEDTSGGFGDDSNTTYAEDSATYTPPDGWEVDLGRDGGYKIESASGERIEAYGVTEAAADHVTVWGKVSAWFEDRTWPESNVSHDGVLDVRVTVYIRKKQPDTTGYTQNLVLTARELCCCEDRVMLPPSVVWEGILKNVTGAGRIGGADAIPVADANRLRSRIGAKMLDSIDAPDRYPVGAVSLAETQVIGRIVSGLVRRPDHPDNVSVRELPGLSREILRKVTEVAPKVSRGRLLTMPLPEIQDRFGLEAAEAAEVRQAAIGLTTPPADPRHRWDPPTRPGPGDGGGDNGDNCHDGGQTGGGKGATDDGPSGGGKGDNVGHDKGLHGGAIAE